ncbi:hypothetical protein QQF64_035751 [Cirrhinus molitorella]|uniref:TIR domain-containing protein n=1 Tax=Cirrhinus molitorella TaxID=172907 RepID=A0ABR3NHF4_9TELE
MRIDEAFSVKQEDTEEQTDLIALKEESQETNEVDASLAVAIRKLPLNCHFPAGYVWSSMTVDDTSPTHDPEPSPPSPVTELPEPTTDGEPEPAAIVEPSPPEVTERTIVPEPEPTTSDQVREPATELRTVEVSVECEGAMESPAHYTTDEGNIPDKATYLDISNNIIQKITKESFSRLSNLKSLNARHNKIREVEEGAFGRLVSLQELNLAYNKLTHILEGMFQNLRNLTVLHLNTNLITNINFLAFSPLISLREVNLSSNQLMKLSQVQTLFLLPQLQEVHIGSNGFTSFQTSELSNISLRLKVLDFSKNPLKVFTITADIFPHLDNLDLAFITENMTWDVQDKSYLQSVHHLNLSGIQLPLEKITDLLQTFNSSLASLRLHFLGDVKVRALMRSVCQISSLRFLGLQWNNITSISKDEMQFCTQLTQLDLSNNRLYSIPAVISSLPVTLLGSFLFHFLKWQVIYAYYLLLAFLHDNKQQKKPSGLQYDAFISYNVHDELWVMRELLPQLEGEQGWKLCLHHRDFEPGKPIMDNIVDGIYSSHKTICVISHHYLESEWCSREIQIASFRLFDEKKDVLILVFLENIPSHQLSPYYRMKRLIQKKTYLSWPKPGEDTRVFWQKLRIALETKGTEQMEHPMAGI